MLSQVFPNRLLHMRLNLLAGPVRFPRQQDQVKPFVGLNQRIDHAHRLSQRNIEVIGLLDDEQLALQPAREP